MKLDKKKGQILEVLVDEREMNPRTSLTGLDMELLGEKVGAYLGISVMYDVADLRYSSVNSLSPSSFPLDLISFVKDSFSMVPHVL